jgi:hypothetical protein
MTHRERRVEILKEAGVALLLALLCALFSWRLFLPNQADRAMIPPGDFTFQFHATRTFIFRELRAGRLPLWMPNIYAGYPIQADPQSAVFYLPGLVLNLGAAMLGFREFPVQLLELEAVAHLFLASLFTYAFLRAQLKRRLSALLGGVVWAYSGYLTGYPLQQMAIVEAAVWLPLALLGIWLRYQGGKRRALWLTALALGMSVLAGHPQTSLFVLYATLAYLIYQLVRARRGWILGIRDTLFVCVLAAALSAVQWLPSLEYMLRSTRASLSLAEAGAGFPFQDIVQFVLTGFVSLWQPLYIGIWPLVLILAAMLLRRQRDTAFWFGLALATLVLSFGQSLSGFDLAYWLLPGYRLFRGQERLALLVSFSLSVLAAYGADGLWSALRRAERAWLRGAARFLGTSLAVLLVGLALVMSLKRQNIDPSDSGELPRQMGLLFMMAAASLSLLSARLQIGRRRVWLSALGLALVVLNLFAANRPLNQTSFSQIYTQSEPLRLMLADDGLFRFQEDYRLTPQSAAVYGLQEVWGVAPIRLAHYEWFWHTVPEIMRWKLLNIKYLVTWRGNPTSREGVPASAELLFQTGKDKDVLYVYRLKEAAPRAWVVHETLLARDRGELYGYLSKADFDPFRTALLVEPLSLSGALTAPERVNILSFAPNKIRLQANLAADGLLVLSEISYPGWRAYVNGRPTRVYEAYGLLRAVQAPAGESVIEFVFQPLTLYVGAAFSLFAWGALLIGALAGLRRQPSGD